MRCRRSCCVCARLHATCAEGCLLGDYTPPPPSDRVYERQVRIRLEGLTPPRRSRVRAAAAVAAASPTTTTTQPQPLDADLGAALMRMLGIRNTS